MQYYLLPSFLWSSHPLIGKVKSQINSYTAVDIHYPVDFMVLNSAALSK